MFVHITHCFFVTIRNLMTALCFWYTSPSDTALKSDYILVVYQNLMMPYYPRWGKFEINVYQIAALSDDFWHG